MFCRALSDSSQVQLLDKLLISGAVLMVPAKFTTHPDISFIFNYYLSLEVFISFLEYTFIRSFNCSSRTIKGRTDTISSFTNTSNVLRHFLQSTSESLCALFSKNAPQTEQCTCHLIFPDPLRLPPLSNNILIHLLLNGSKGNKIRLLSITIVHSVSVKATRTITISMIQIRFVSLKLPSSFPTDSHSPEVS